MVEHELGPLDALTQLARAAMGGHLLQLEVLAVGVFAQHLAHPGAAAINAHGIVNIAGQQSFPDALGLWSIGVGSGAFHARSQQGVDQQVRVHIRSHWSHLDALAGLAGQGNADHAAAIGRAGGDFVGRFVVGVQSAVGVHAGVQHQAHVFGRVQDAVGEVEAQFRHGVWSVLIVEKILSVAGQTHVGMHAAAVDAGDGFGQEGGGHVHGLGHLTAEQLVQLDAIGGDQGGGILEVHFELAGPNLGMVLLVLEAHGALHFRRGVDEAAQRVLGQAIEIAAGADQIKDTGFVIVAFRVAAVEDETLYFGRDVGHGAVFLVHLLGVFHQASAEIRFVWLAVLAQHGTEDQNLARTEDVRRHPVEGPPVDAQTQIAFGDLGEAADGRAVEGELVGAQQEFLVVIQHVQAAFQIRESDGHGLDALLAIQIIAALFFDLGHGGPVVLVDLDSRFSSSRRSYGISRNSRSGALVGFIGASLDMGLNLVDWL